MSTQCNPSQKVVYMQQRNTKKRMFTKNVLPSVEYTLGQLADARIFSNLDANYGFWHVPLADESAFIYLTDNLHHALWKILFQAIALRHFISAGTLPEKDVNDPGGN